jgi:membrane-associated protease RseP (regulator of RpoE activity)
MQHSNPSAAQETIAQETIAQESAAEKRELIVDDLLLTQPADSAPIPQPRYVRRGETVAAAPPVNRRLLRSVILFLLTCFTTFFAGVANWNQGFLGDDPQIWQLALQAQNYMRGLEYMACIMAILLAHEMGHFLMTIRHGIAATFPIFLPFPSLFTGTLGAVIALDGPRANRKQLFDIGVAGPIAGLFVIVPVLYYGILIAKPAAPGSLDSMIGDPLLVQLLKNYLHPELANQPISKLNPWLMAGWVGCLITGLNMFPMSQLDGGHVVYCMFGKTGNLIARATLFASMAAIIYSNYYLWSLMIILVTVVLGVNHPPTADDTVPLGRTRMIIGCLSLTIPIFCFIPRPFLG